MVYSLYLVDDGVIIIIVIIYKRQWGGGEKKLVICLVEITEHQMCNLESATTTTVFGSVIITIIIYPLTIMSGLNPDYYVICM